MSTTSTNKSREIRVKVKDDSATAAVSKKNAIVQKTYRMAETLKNTRLPGE